MGIPKNERKFHTKVELAFKIVEQARENRLNYGYRKNMSNPNFNFKGNVFSRLSAVILPTVVVMLCLNSFSLAKNCQIQFDIPAQDLRSALIEFADITGLSLIYDIGNLSGMESDSVSGSYCPLEALRIILGDCKLIFEKTGKESIAIRKDKQTQVEMKEKARESSQTVDQSMATTKVGQPRIILKTEKNAHEGARMLEEITVTGTRIKGVEAVGSSVIGLDRNAIKISSEFTLDSIIREIPAIMELGVTEMSRASAEGLDNAFYMNSANIHGVGPNSTLTLIDGHRVTNNGVATDMNVLPVIGVERIEVAAGGSSAVYGSDAVAGVVNIIPRRKLDGVDTSFRYGTGEDIYRWSAGAAVGQLYDSGQFMVAYERSYRDQLDARDRPFSTADQRPYGGPDYRSTRSSPGTIISGGTTYAIPEDGLTTNNVDQLVAGTENLGEPDEALVLTPEQKSDNANFTAGKFWNKIEFFADGFYSERKFFANKAYPTAVLTVPSTNAWFVPLPDYPDLTSYQVAINYKDAGFPLYIGYGEQKNWQISPGIRYNLPFGFQLEGLFSYGETNSFSSYNNSPSNTDARDAALASSDPETALDVYGLGRTSPETIAAIASRFFDQERKSTFKGYQLNINGPLFELPAGTAKIAAGYEGQRHSMTYGIGTGNEPDDPRKPDDYWREETTRDVNSGYLELYIPVFGAQNNVTGINRLDVTAAIRYDDYSDVGDTTNPRFGVNYSPIEPLRFYFNYGSSFRAPSLALLERAQRGEIRIQTTNYVVPGGGGATVEGITLVGPNPNIKPETADTWTLGARYALGKDTIIDISYFSVDYSDKVVNNRLNTTILKDEAAYAGTGVILRGAEAAAMANYYNDNFYDLIVQTEGTDIWPDGSPDNVTLWVDGRSLNLAKSVTEGFDISISHNWRTDTAGDYRFWVSGTYLTKYEEAFAKNATPVDLLNQLNAPLQFKARGGVDWHNGSFITRASFDYVNGYDNPSTIPTQKVDAWTTFDLAVQFDGDNVGWLGSFGDGLSITLDVTNILDEDPPYVNFAPNANGGGGWDPTAASPIGRMIGISLRKVF